MGFSMFERPRHRAIEQLLAAFDAKLLADLGCHFGGGTAIVLSLKEYRESMDLDFLCSDLNGFRALRNLIDSKTLGTLVQGELHYAREVRSGRDKISTFVKMNDFPIKVEFIFEGNIQISGKLDPNLGVSTLSRTDMYATKLLANADRWKDLATNSRDIIDLAMMINTWGSIPAEAWHKAKVAYGEIVAKNFEKACAMAHDSAHILKCLERMGMEQKFAQTIQGALSSEIRIQRKSISKHTNLGSQSP